MDETKVDAIAQAAADKAIIRLFEVFGADVSTPEGRKMVQDDWNWVRETRIGTRVLRNTTIGALVVSIASGLAIAVWKGLAALAMAASRT